MSINDCRLQANRIDIWEFPLNQLSQIAGSLLNEAESARANRFHFERHKRRFTLARAALRLILGRYLQEDARLLHFLYTEHGKPSLDNLQSLEFNLSHSGDLALVAVGQYFPLGIDLEFFSARPYEGIANNLFSPMELKSFLSLPNYLKPQVFFHIWAQKEAFIKAGGLGLAYPTQQFSVPLFSPAQALIEDSIHQKEWLLSSFMPKVGCNAALCRHPEVNTVRYLRILDIVELFGSQG